MAKGTTTTFHFEYGGTLTGADTSPVEGIKLAAVADPITILLYPGRWFPMTGLFTDRFTAEMHIRVPSDYTAVGSGIAGHEELLGGKTRVQLQVGEAGISGDDCCGQVSAAGAWRRCSNISRVHDGQAEGVRRGVCARWRRGEFEYLTSVFGAAGVGPDQRGGAAGRCGVARRGLRRWRRLRVSRIGRPEECAAAAGEYAGAPVVGVGGVAGDAERCVDYERHEPLCAS